MMAYCVEGERGVNWTGILQEPLVTLGPLFVLSIWFKERCVLMCRIDIFMCGVHRLAMMHLFIGRWVLWSQSVNDAASSLPLWAPGCSQSVAGSDIDLCLLGLDQGLRVALCTELPV